MTSDNDVEVPTATTTGDNEYTPVVKIDSEHREGALIIQTDRTFYPEEHRKLKLYFSKMLARLYAGEDASLDSAWRTLQFHYDLVDDWVRISSIISCLFDDSRVILDCNLKHPRRKRHGGF